MKSNLFLVLVQLHLFTGYACRGLTPSNLDQCSWCVQRWCTWHFSLECLEQQSCAPSAELRLPPLPADRSTMKQPRSPRSFRENTYSRVWAYTAQFLDQRMKLSFASELIWCCSTGLSDTRQEQPCWVTGGGSVTKLSWPQRDRPWPFWLHLSARLANL